MNIINTNLSFSPLSTRKSTTRIILHHAAASTCGAVVIHRWHKQRGWSGIGYHFVVRKNGTIERGRPENKTGAHASGHNYDSIGVCFEGNFETEAMYPAQLRAGQELLAYLKKRYKIQKIQCHREVGSTSCPGRNFPFTQMAGASAPSSPSHTVVPAPPDKLAVDGCWGRKTTLRLQNIFGTPADGIVSNQHLCYKSQNPGLDSGWDWKDKPAGASPLIKAIQKKVGASPDGHIGPQTIKAIQKWQNSTPDGTFSVPSPCIKKIQKWCNNQ